MEIEEINFENETTSLAVVDPLTFWADKTEENPAEKPPLIASPKDRKRASRSLARKLRYSTSIQGNLYNLQPQSSITALSNVVERRATVDIGSGSTKVFIADVDVKTNRVVSKIFEVSLPVAYQHALATNNNYFDQAIQNKGIEVFEKVRDLLSEYQVDKVAAIATEAFRKAVNGKEFAEKVAQTTSIPVKIITQEEEGAIAFFSAIAKDANINPNDILVWDIGTGSYQLTIKGENGLVIFMGQSGSVPFKNYIIKEIQHQDPAKVTSVNPMTEEQLIQADIYARYLARQAFPEIKYRIKDLEGKVLGIGRLFYNSIKPMAHTEGKITRKDLRKFIADALNKTDDQLNDPFSHINLSNAILVLGFMKALHIQEVRPVDTTTAYGMLAYDSFWV